MNENVKNENDLTYAMSISEGQSQRKRAIP